MDNRNNEVYCFSYFHAKEGYREQLIAALLALIQPTKDEPGCLEYILLSDNENQNHLIMFEKFVDQAALDWHEHQAYIRDFVDNKMSFYCEKVTWHVANEIR